MLFGGLVVGENVVRDVIVPVDVPFPVLLQEIENVVGEDCELTAVTV